MPTVRLRQVALVAEDLDSVVAQLRREFGIGAEPFCDPGVSVFGLRNAVLAVGDTFFEVLSPIRPDTTAGRYLERRGGDGGYMVIFQVDDLDAARARIEGLGVRVVWRADHADIAATHLHPKDVPGALVSIDWADPPGSWRWAGPQWTGVHAAQGAGGIAGLTVQSERPAELAARWAEVLGRSVTADDGDAACGLDGGTLHFVHPRDGRGEGIVAVDVELPGALPRQITIGGVTMGLGPVDS